MTVLAVLTVLESTLHFSLLVLQNTGQSANHDSCDCFGGFGHYGGFGGDGYPLKLFPTS